jgi:hypothetical protein
MAMSKHRCNSTNVQLEMLLEMEEIADFHDSRFLTVSCFCDNMSNDEYCRGKSAGQFLSLTQIDEIHTE